LRTNKDKEYQIDHHTKSAVFTYEQFMRHVAREYFLMGCPFCEEEKASLFIFVEKCVFSCTKCTAMGTVVWEKDHVVLKKGKL